VLPSGTVLILGAGTEDDLEPDRADGFPLFALRGGCIAAVVVIAYLTASLVVVQVFAGSGASAQWSIGLTLLVGLVAVIWLLYRAHRARSGTGVLASSDAPLGLVLGPGRLEALEPRLAAKLPRPLARPLAYAGVRVDRRGSAPRTPLAVVNLALMVRDSQDLTPRFSLTGEWDYKTCFATGEPLLEPDDALPTILRLADVLAATSTLPPPMPSEERPPEAGSPTLPPCAHLRGTEDCSDAALQGAWFSARSSGALPFIALSSLVIAIGVAGLLPIFWVLGPCTIYVAALMVLAWITAVVWNTWRPAGTRERRSTKPMVAWYARPGALVLTRQPPTSARASVLEALILPRVLLDRAGARVVVRRMEGDQSQVTLAIGPNSVAWATVDQPPAATAERIRELFASACMVAPRMVML